jgi:Sigma-70 region 2
MRSWPSPAADRPARRPRIWSASRGTRGAACSCLAGEGGRRIANGRVVGELERFLAERADYLMRTAVLLTGSHEAGQDLLQTALERLIRHWGTLRGDPEGYLRRTLYNLAADGFRRQGRLQCKLALCLHNLGGLGSLPEGYGHRAQRPDL